MARTSSDPARSALDPAATATATLKSGAAPWRHATGTGGLLDSYLDSYADRKVYTATGIYTATGRGTYVCAYKCANVCMYNDVGEYVRMLCAYMCAKMCASAWPRFARIARRGASAWPRFAWSARQGLSAWPRFACSARRGFRVPVARCPAGGLGTQPFYHAARGFGEPARSAAALSPRSNHIHIIPQICACTEGF